jgi:hypothetical protein
MRERFDHAGRLVTDQDLDAHLVELTGQVRVLDLRKEATLDALGLDDQLSTSRAPDIWAASQRLSDLTECWFGEQMDGIVYRSGTAPEHSANLAYFAHTPLRARDLGRLRDQEELLLTCVDADQFTIVGMLPHRSL